MHIRNPLKKGTKWSVGDGKSVDLWFDWWCGNSPIVERIPGLHTQIPMKVEEIIDNGRWNLVNIDHLLSNEVRNEILNTVLPVFSQTMDHPVWADSQNGTCFASNAYDFINDESNDLKEWQWFWKLKVPQKFKTFLWLIFHNKLPTNLLRFRRGITNSDLCPRCNNSSENLDHLFKDCPKAIELWDSVPSGQQMRRGLGDSTAFWISSNLKKGKLLQLGNSIPWNLLFCTTLWQIWKDRNRKSFDNIDALPDVSSKILCSYANEIVEAFKSPLLSGPPKNRLTKWFPPLSGTIKLNTDGCWYESNGKAGFGGIFRNAAGDWVLGYYGKMRARSSLETEVWSIYRGLTIILEKGLSNIQIESDSQTSVLLINEGANTNHPQSNIVNDGHYILNRTGCTISHNYRGANECADFLARFGAEQTEELVVIDQPPIEIREFMNRDRLNTRSILD